MGLMRSLSLEAFDRDYSDRELIWRIGKYFRQWRVRLIIIVVTLFLRSLFGAATPLLLARGVEQMEVSGREQLIAILMAVVLLLGFLVWVTNWIQRRLTAMLIGDVVLALREDAFRAVMGHDMSFYDEYQSGRIVSRISSDSDEFGRVAMLITQVMSQFLFVILLTVVLFTIEPRLTGLVLLMPSLLFLVSWSFRPVTRRVTQRSQRAVGEVNVSIQEAVTGISVAKNFRREAGIYEEFDGVNHLNYDTNVRRGFVLSMLYPTLQAVSGVVSAILLYYGGLSVTATVITASAWYLFMNSIEKFWHPMLQLAAFWSQFQAGLSATERIFALIDAEPIVRQSNGKSPLELAYKARNERGLQGDIRFEDVTFGYREDEPVLINFNLHIQPGESVALVGHTGAGKSSIAKLVTRFYEFQQGKLLIDEQDIRTLDLTSYRRQLGIVSQVPFLFNGTVADNIRYTRPDMSDEEVSAIAHQIRGDWIDTLPNGLQTDVGERGNKLSLGQRQLVVLARVMAQNPAIFIRNHNRSQATRNKTRQSSPCTA